MSTSGCFRSASHTMSSCCFVLAKFSPTADGGRVRTCPHGRPPIEPSTEADIEAKNPQREIHEVGIEQLPLRTLPECCEVTSF